MIDLSKVDISKWNIDETGISDLEALIRMTDPWNIALVTDTLGLMIHRKKGTVIDTSKVPKDVDIRSDRFKRAIQGAKITVLDLNGVIPSDLFIDRLCVIKDKNGNIEGYLLELSEYFEIDGLDALLGDEYMHGWLLNLGDKMYCHGFDRDIPGVEEAHWFKIDKLLFGVIRLTINDKVYAPKIINVAYDVYDLIER